MNYKNSYLEMTDIAEKIRQGHYSVTKNRQQSAPSGFMSPVNFEQKETPYNPTEEMMEMMLSMEGPVREEGSSNRAMFTTDNPSDIDVAVEALAMGESRGSGNYKAVGPVVKGDRAYGRYQVMGQYIPVWTKQILGKEMTPQQFLNDPEAQDQVVRARLQSSFDKYGTWEDAASVWFSGRPLKKAGNASDGYLTVPEYVDKFTNNFGALLGGSQ